MSGAACNDRCSPNVWKFAFRDQKVTRDFLPSFPLPDTLP
jgi:hypothetical protein